mmetsp:Transcript_9951/g.18173  ORF Transcript_9951/g.18173 Transcript_9951/m.18173 type:complete len:110 (-) Transcript_9951:688-1017(-)
MVSRTEARKLNICFSIPMLTIECSQSRSKKHDLSTTTRSKHSVHVIICNVLLITVQLQSDHESSRLEESCCVIIILEPLAPRGRKTPMCVNNQNQFHPIDLPNPTDSSP